MEFLFVIMGSLLPVFIFFIYIRIKRKVGLKDKNRKLRRIHVKMSKILWNRKLEQKHKNKITHINPLKVSVQGATILEVYRDPSKLFGISNTDSNATTIDIENQTSFVFEPYESISFCIDAEVSEDFVIEVEEASKNGYHAKFILKNQNNYNRTMDVSLRPEAADIVFYDGDEYSDNTQIIPAKFYNKEYEKAKYDWVFAHLIKLYNFVLVYEDVLVPKCEQYIYVNEWGEDVIEESLWQAIDKLLDKFYENYSPYDLKEYEKLQKIAINPYFPSNPLDGESEVYKVIFLKHKNVNAGDVEFAFNVVVAKNKADIKIQYYNASEHTEGIEWTPETRTYYCDGGVVLGYIKALAELNKKENKTTQKKVSPLDYEKQIMVLLKRLGFNAKNTKASGDQGADVLADKNGKKFAIQCKMYSKPVGNKAVQEVNAARDYYKCDYAVVVTNSSYTPAARKAANACGVILLHDSQLERLYEFI